MWHSLAGGQRCRTHRAALAAGDEAEAANEENRDEHKRYYWPQVW